MAKTTNLLKDMKIEEISLVTAGMNQGANILFTKGKIPPVDWRAAITGDVQVGKAVMAGAEAQKEVDSWRHEARDPKGKWTTAAIAAIGGKQGSYRRQIAQGFADKARTIAHGTITHTLHAVKTTRATGANPITGGGVEFQFEHQLHPSEGQMEGSKVQTRVQIRPEHLGRTEADHAGVILGRRMGRLPSNPNKAQRALHQLHRGVKALGRSEVPAFEGPKSLLARATVHPATVARGIANAIGMGGTGTSQAPVTPTSTDAAAGGYGWKPPMIPAQWVRDTQNLRPVGHGRKTDISDADAPQIPLKGHTARSAGGWPYYTADNHFIPGGRPDIQEHMEKVHQELARMPADQRAGFVKNRAGGAYLNVTDDKGYFSHQGDYIPPVGEGPNRAQARLRFEGRYEKERERMASGQGEPTAGVETPAHKLFGPESPGGGREYDTTTNADAAREAARQDMMKKGRFFQAAYPESMVRRFPTPAYEPTYRWQSAAEAPGFAPRLTAREPLSKAAKYGRAKAKARLK